MSDHDSRQLRNNTNADRFRYCVTRTTAILQRLLLMVFAFSIGLSFFSDSTALSQTKAEDASRKWNSEKVLIESILTEQTQAWNDGDLEKFMETYWKSDNLTFSSGGKTTYGWQATLDNYKKSYATPKQMGQLHFDGLEISEIESNSALVLGKWHLKMQGGEDRDGNFSLVVKRLEPGWKIIHDHSSSLDPEKKVDPKKND